MEVLYDLDLKRHHKIYTSVHEMMDDRGYTPTEDQLDFDHYVSKYEEILQIAESVFDVIDSMSLVFRDTKRDKKMFIYFHFLDSKLCQTDMNYIHKLMDKKGATHLIIVANNKATPKVTNVLNLLGYEAQFFIEEQVITNIMKHQLVPPHRRITGVEREKILEQFGKPESFPAMFSNDPVAMRYNYKVNDLIEIKRPRYDGHHNLYYRIVTDPLND